MSPVTPTLNGCPLVELKVRALVAVEVVSGMPAVSSAEFVETAVFKAAIAWVTVSPAVTARATFVGEVCRRPGTER